MTVRRMTTQQVLSASTREHARLTTLIAALGSGASTIRVTEDWTAKDVLAHLIHWANHVAFGLGAAVDPPTYIRDERRRRHLAGLSNTTPNDAESNSLAVAFHSRRSLDSVSDEFERVVDALISRVRRRTDDEMNATDAIPTDPGRPLWQFIGEETFLHWPQHSDDIERARPH